jgi:hypothetical protein
MHSSHSEAVGITEEDAEDRAEVGDELVGGTARDQPVADRLERLERSGLHREVVEPAPAEHRYLTVGLDVAVDLEHVQLCELADLDDREPDPAPSGGPGTSVTTSASNRAAQNSCNRSLSLVSVATWLKPASSTARTLPRVSWRSEADAG